MADRQAMLVDAWKDSCDNLRSSQDRFRNAINVFVVSSFAITAFLLREKNVFGGMSIQIAAIADVFLLTVYTLLIALTYKEISMARKTVELYQDTLKKAFDNLDSVKSIDLFQAAKGKPRMPLLNELLVACVAILVVATKAAFLFCWAR